MEKDLSTIGYSTPLLADPNSMLEARMHPRPWWEGQSDPGLHDVNATASNPKQGEKTGNPTKTDPIGRNPKAARARLLTVVEALGAKHMVIGHQPGKVEFADGSRRKDGEMFAHADGLLFMIDTGMSRGVADGPGAVLRIERKGSHETATAIYSNGHEKVLWQK